MDDRERLILLNTIPDVGSLRFRRLLDAFGSLAAIFTASAAQMRQVEGIGPVLAERIAGWPHEPSAAEDELRRAERAGCAVITWLDEAFPVVLKNIPDPPMVIYMKGQWVPEDQTAVGVVGSRLASLYGQQMAQRLAHDLALHGVTIVSGLARGIDGAAHRGALKAQGRTIGVIGSGFNRFYPPEHVDLAEEIAAHGAVISEYPMEMEPVPANFPRRNRLISGLSLGVVIVEAAKRSGALITADCALEQGREVFAVPGKADSATSQGTHQLLRQGARLATSADDILEELGLGPGAAAPRRVGVTDDERMLMEQLKRNEPRDVDLLAEKTGLPAAVCASALLGLELKRLVKQLPGKRFVPWN